MQPDEFSSPNKRWTNPALPFPKMFLFASDYPHWQFDGDDPIPPHLPKSIVTRMCEDNPLETFPRLKLNS